MRTKLVRPLFAALSQFVLAFTPAPARAEGYTAEIVDYGIYEIQKGRRKEDPNVAGGLRISLSKKLKQQTTRVPAELGTNFGFRYKLFGSGSEADVTIHVDHPKLRDPTGKEFASSEWSQSVPVGGFVNWNTGWVFEEEWEMIPGAWTIRLSAAGQELAEKRFTVGRESP